MENPYFIYIVYLAFFICTAVFAFLINGLFLKFAGTLGIRNTKETIIRWSSQSKPSVGGISFYIIFLLSITSYSIFFNDDSIMLNLKFLGILSSVTLAFLIGLADDAYNTRPLLKFTAQVICAIILIATGTFISLFDSNILNYALTLLWMVGIMNSINMLDNMDAITGLVSACIIIATLFILYSNNDISNIHVIILIGVLASLAGFLFYNWHPAKLYMGDTGSQFLGNFLGTMGIIYFWNNAGEGNINIPSKQIILVLLVFIIPLVDTTSVVINRLLKKQSPFIGGKDHITHHLSYLGLRDNQVARIILLLSIVSLLFIVIIVKFITVWSYLHFIAFGSFIILVFLILYYITRTTRAKNVETKPDL